MKLIRILIVEDEAIEAFLLSNCLRLEGYQVCELAAHGSDAMRITRQDQPDIIVMDMGLAGSMSGLETARQIRGFSCAPILFLTGCPSDPMRDQIAQLKPAQHLSKPARINEILSTIQQMLAYPPST